MSHIIMLLCYTLKSVVEEESKCWCELLWLPWWGGRCADAVGGADEGGDEAGGDEGGDEVGGGEGVEEGGEEGGGEGDRGGKGGAKGGWGGGGGGGEGEGQRGGEGKEGVCGARAAVRQEGDWEEGAREEEEGSVK